MNFHKPSLLLALAASQLFAAETLFSNYAYKVFPGSSEGKLYVYSIGDVACGMTEVTLKSTTHGVTVDKSEQTSIGDSLSAMQSGILSSTWAEHRRIPSVKAEGLGFILPMYGVDKNGYYLDPLGIFSVRNIERIVETPLDPPAYEDELDSAMTYAPTGLSFDSSSMELWIARGTAGLTRYDIFNGPNDPEVTNYILNKKNSKLEKLGDDYAYKASRNPSIHDVAVHPQTHDIWLATEKGLWVKHNDELKTVKHLDTTKRVTGIWMGGEPLQIIVEVSKPDDEGTNGTLWRSTDSKNFKKVDFLDTTGKVQKNNVFADLNYTVTDIAFLGKKAFIGVTSTSGSDNESGYLVLDSTGIRAWETDEDDGSQWLNGFARGVTDREDVTITSITTFPLTSKIEGLAVSTSGNGISVSADSGATWTSILNRARLGDNLGSVRMVPSVIFEGNGIDRRSVVAYKVSKASKITIEVFSYDMRKVRTIVKDAPREADKSRSTFASEDFWDGKDDYGRPCTMGIYYVRVKDNHGNVGWGKVMTMGGR